MEWYCFCWIRSADMTRKQWEIPEPNVISRIQKDVIRPTSWPPHPCIPTAPNQKVVLWKLPGLSTYSSFLTSSSKLSTASDTLQTLCCVHGLCLCSGCSPYSEHSLSLSLVNFPWNPSELALPFPTTAHAPTWTDYALLCASPWHARHTPSRQAVLPSVDFVFVNSQTH